MNYFLTNWKEVIKVSSQMEVFGNITRFIDLIKEHWIAVIGVNDSYLKTLLRDHALSAIQTTKTVKADKKVWRSQCIGGRNNMWIIKSHNPRWDISCYKYFIVFNESISTVATTFAVHFLQEVFIKALNVHLSTFQIKISNYPGHSLSMYDIFNGENSKLSTLKYLC